VLLAWHAMQATQIAVLRAEESHPSWKQVGKGRCRAVARTVPEQRKFFAQVASRSCRPGL